MEKPVRRSSDSQFAIRNPQKQRQLQKQEQLQRRLQRQLQGQTKGPSAADSQWDANPSLRMTAGRASLVVDSLVAAAPEGEGFLGFGAHDLGGRDGAVGVLDFELLVDEAVVEAGAGGVFGGRGEE